MRLLDSAVSPHYFSPHSIFTQEATEKYRSTWIAIISTMCATIVMSMILRFYLIAENRRKDREQEEATAALADKARSSMSLDEKSEPSLDELRVLARDLSDRQVRFF